MAMSKASLAEPVNDQNLLREVRISTCHDRKWDEMWDDRAFPSMYSEGGVLAGIALRGNLAVMGARREEHARSARSSCSARSAGACLFEASSH